MFVRRLSRAVVAVVLTISIVLQVPFAREAVAATSVTIRLDAAHTVVVTASAGLRSAGLEDVPAFAGVSDVIHRFDLVVDARIVGTLAITVRSLPEGNIVVFSRLDAPGDQVHVDLDVRTRSDSHTFRGLDPSTPVDPPLDRHFGYDYTTNPIGFLQIERDGRRTSSLFLGKAYEFRQLTTSYPGGKESWVKELVREDSAYSIGRVADASSVRLFMSGNKTSCERYFVLSPRPILEGSLGSTDIGLFTQTRFRWLDPTGPYMKGPWSIEPFTRDGYIRSLQQLRSISVIREALTTGSPFMRDMAYNSLYSLWLIRGTSDGLWRTHWTSTWVGAESGIVAPYIDSRHNELIALWLMEFARTMDVSPQLAITLGGMARPYPDFLVDKANKGEVIRTGRGFFFPAYFNDPGAKHSFATLNHSLGAFHILVRTYQETGDRKYLNPALSVRDAVSETATGWIRESGDLWYAMKPSGEFFDQDYPTLTLVDLVFGQQLLEAVGVGREAAFDTLIQSKTAYLNRGILGVAGHGEPGSVDEHTPSASTSEQWADEPLPGGWWAAPEEGREDLAPPEGSATAGEQSSPLEGLSATWMPELGRTPITDAFVSGESTTALYRLPVPDGRIVRIRLVGPAASDFDMRLYAPGGGPGLTEPVATRATYLYPETLSYVLPPEAGGDYVLEIVAKWGQGEYTVSREVLTPTHSEIEDARPASTPLSGRIDLLRNVRDTYAIELSPGDHVVASIRGSTSNTLGVRLLGPDARSATEGAACGPAYVDRFSYTVPAGRAGTYYFDVHGVSAGATYEVDFTVRTFTPAEKFPGAELAAGPTVNGWVDWANRPFEMRWIDLEPGESVRLALLRPSWGVPIDAYLYPPGTQTFLEAPLASARGWGREVGLAYAVPEDGGGRYQVVVHASAGSGSYRLAAARGGEPLSIDGSDRYSTAVEASKRAYPLGLAQGGARTVVVATGHNWPDALGGASLAGVVDGPVLLVRQTVVSPVVLEEIKRLGATRAIILGGTTAVGANVERTLESELGPEGSVRRIAGANRYETADKIAREVVSLQGDAYDGRAFVATGANFPDALAAAPLAAAKGWPLYLARPRSGISAKTGAAMEGVTDAVILGGAGAVSLETETYLRSTLGSSKVVRLQGSDRYRTAVAVADYAVGTQGHSWNRVGITTGADFPDALAGGIVQGKASSVMLLTPSAKLSSVTARALVDNKYRIATFTYFGGDAALSQTVRSAVKQAVE